MEQLKIITIKESVYADNDLEANKLRQELKEQKTFLLNLMSSPGAGKTTTLINTLSRLIDEMKIGVMEADIDSAVDAERMLEAQIPAIQVHTGGMCHLDAGMTRQGLEALGSENYDFVVLENVGNLVCPAEFDTGASKSAMILSVPEGDDKPLKYPLMFSNVDAVLINKIDCLDYFEFDVEAVKERVYKLNPEVAIFEISARNGQGIEDWCDWLRKEVADWNSK